MASHVDPQSPPGPRNGPGDEGGWTRYETLVNSLDGIVWEADPRTFQFTFVSRQAERLLGYPVQRWLVEPGFWRDHLHPDDRDWAVSLCLNAVEKGQSHEFEYRMVAADGRTVWLRDIVTVVSDGGRATLRGVMVDVTARKLAEETLWNLIRGTASATGREFFPEFVRRLAAALDARVAAVTEVVPGRPRVLRTLAMWVDGDWRDITEYVTTGTPCERVLGAQDTLYYPRGLREQFPDDKMLAELGVESYLGTPLRGASGAVIGHVCVLGDRPLTDEQHARSVMSVFAARAAAELDRQHAEQRLLHRNTVLLELARSEELGQSDFPAFARLATRRAAATLGVERVGVWLFNEDRSVLRCECLYERSRDLHSRGATLNAASYPRYFTALARGRAVMAEDARRHPDTSEFSETYLGPLGIASMLDAPLRLGSELKGVVCHEHVGAARSWAAEDLDFAASVADFVGLALEASARRRAENAVREAQEQLLVREREEGKRVQSELEKLKDELVQRTRLATIGQVAASIAHDLRNPLGAIRNAGYYLRRKLPPDEPKWVECVNIIEQETDAADRIVSNLLEMSRAKQPAKEAVELGEVVREAFDRVRRPWGIRLRLAVEPRAATVHADPGQLRQVLSNLVTNSVQALGDSGEIVVEACSDGAFDTITLRDNGPGIPNEQRHRVFEPLFTTKAKGTGLGLAICRQIVQQHGGTIELVDHDRPGAAFRIRLPRPRPGATEAPRDGPTVLVVDDEKNMRTTLAEILRDEGYRVYTAETGEKAVRMCGRQDIDVVLMDVRMPGIDGVEAFRRIRQQRQGVRVIMMSAYSVDELEKVALAEGAVAFLRKPLQIDSVVKLIGEGRPGGQTRAS
jgi:PAS domain S-box-containing protein